MATMGHDDVFDGRSAPSPSVRRLVTLSASVCLTRITIGQMRSCVSSAAAKWREETVYQVQT